MIIFFEYFKNFMVFYVLYFINTAVACAEMGNFNSALAIALGLTLTPAGRLSKAWKKVDESKIKILRHIINPDQNFKNYRMIFKAVSSKSFDDDSVLVPFFSLFLKDMYFLGTMILQEDGSKVSHLGGQDWYRKFENYFTFTFNFGFFKLYSTIFP